MPAGKTPPSWKNAPKGVKRKASEILDALLKDGVPEDKAIPIALSRARKFMSKKQEELEQDIDNNLEEAVCPYCEKSMPKAEMKDHMSDCSAKENDEESEARDDSKTESAEEEEEKEVESVELVDEDAEVSLVGEAIETPIVESVQILEALSEGNEWKVVMIAPGVSKNKTYYSSSMLAKRVDLFEGALCFANHAEDERSLSEIVGWYTDAKYESGVGITANFHALESQAWFAGMMREAYKRGKPDLFGFSINGLGTRRLGKVNGESVFVVEDLHKIDSVDAVIHPSAGGRILKLVASVTKNKEDLELIDKMTLDELKETRPDLYEEIVKATEAQNEEKMKELETEMAKLREQAEEENKDTPESTTTEEDKTKADELARLEEETKAKVAKIEEMVAQAEERARVAECKAVLASALASSELPDPIKKKIERKYSGKIFETTELEADITEEKEILEKLFEDENVPYTRTANVTVGASQRDKAVKALDGFWDNAPIEGVAPARTLMEAYAMFTGRNSWDTDPISMMRESRRDEYDSSSRILESLSAGSWAEVLGDSITRRMLKEYNDLPYNEWRQFCDVVNIPDFRTQRRTRFGGYSTLPAVSEQAAYVTMTSPGDEETTYSISKRGGLERLTLEMIAKDDVGSIRRIPFKLARAAKITLYRFVFDMVSLTGAGAVTLGYDSTKLFTSAHANSVTTVTGVDAGLNDANLTTAKQKLAKQAAYGESTHLLGLRGKFLVTTIDNEATAQRILGNDYLYYGGAATTTGAQTDINVHKNTLQLVTVPYFQDDTDGRSDRWVVVADPADVPTIEIGFFQGRQEPELFTQDMETVGTMFDSDQLTYKIRHIYGGTILDHRGFVGSALFA